MSTDIFYCDTNTHFQSGYTDSRVFLNIKLRPSAASWINLQALNNLYINQTSGYFLIGLTQILQLSNTYFGVYFDGCVSLF